MRQTKKKTPVKILPVIPLRGIVFLPGSSISFDIGRDMSIVALKKAAEEGRELLLVSQKDPLLEDPTARDLYRVGTLASVHQVLELGSQRFKLMAEGLGRMKVLRYRRRGGSYEAEVLPLELENPGAEEALQIEAGRRILLQQFEKYAVVTGQVSTDTVDLVRHLSNIHYVVDVILDNTDLPLEAKQAQLALVKPVERIEQMIIMLTRELELNQLGRKIDGKVREAMERNQREYFLREQMKSIRDELGEDDRSEAEAFLEKLEKSRIPKEHREKLQKEIERFSRMPENFSEATVQRNWISLLLELPFGRKEKESLDLGKAKRILNAAHYGMDKVKKRILEYIAVRKLQTDAGDSRVKGPILCFVGPPGVGKTSVAKSIAEALGRRYVRMSLGGIHDEAEIRGHRRTYVGAMPGRIVQGIRQVDSDNPLFLLDEIDKLGSDFRGDPASALLEVLDPEQNNSFRDHYLELPYDLSQVLFITTANSAYQIPEPLLDRMELIELSGYTEEEKIEIARKHLLPKQREIHALTAQQVKISRAGLARLISDYTSEAGVRQLERELAHLCRVVAVKLVSEKRKQVSVTVRNLEELIGRRKYSFDPAAKKPQVGCVRGLAWTYAGGDTLTIEANVLPGNGKLALTGQLGDVMKESAQAALTYIRSRAKSLGLALDFADKCDVHLHVPAGAVPKDGPSAGITLATALASALTGRPARHDLAMTGEITLRGRVLPIGGLKEKAVAAKRAGIVEILIPKENERDMEDIPETVTKHLKIHTVDTMDQVLRLALLPDPIKEPPAFLRETKKQAAKPEKKAK